MGWAPVATLSALLGFGEANLFAHEISMLIMAKKPCVYRRRGVGWRRLSIQCGNNHRKRRNWLWRRLLRSSEMAVALAIVIAHVGVAVSALKYRYHQPGSGRGLRAWP